MDETAGKRIGPLGAALEKTCYLAGAAILCGMLLTSAGCKASDSGMATAEQKITQFFPGGRKTQPDPGEIQQSLLRFSETYALQLIESVNEIEHEEGSPFTPEHALRFKISSVSSIITISTGENPNVSMLSLVTLTTMSRMVLENHWAKQPNGEIFQKWLERNRALEKKIWRIAGSVLSQEQQDELRKGIEEYFASQKHLDSVFMAHPENLMVQKKLAQGGNERSILSLAAINPFSGLDPTVREITKTRLFAERALFSIQWMPWLLRWQSDLLLLETTSHPKIARTLEDVSNLSESIQRASLAAESLGKTAAGLPAQLSTEREAIVKALDEQEGQITTMLQAGEELSTSLNTTIGSLDALMKRFGVGEPKPPRDPNRKRFDILDYAKTADSFTAAAKELNTTLTELNASLDSPAMDRLSKETAAGVRGILNHLFLLAAGFVVLIFACALAYRKAAKPQSPKT